MESPETKLCLYEILVQDSGGHEVPCSDRPPRWEPAIRSRQGTASKSAPGQQTASLHPLQHSHRDHAVSQGCFQPVTEMAGVLELGHFCLTQDSCKGQSLFWGSPVAQPKLSQSCTKAEAIHSQSSFLPSLFSQVSNRHCGHSCLFHFPLPFILHKSCP